MDLASKSRSFLLPSLFMSSVAGLPFISPTTLSISSILLVTYEKDVLHVANHLSLPKAAKGLIILPTHSEVDNDKKMTGMVKNDSARKAIPSTFKCVSMIKTGQASLLVLAFSIILAFNISIRINCFQNLSFLPLHSVNFMMSLG